MKLLLVIPTLHRGGAERVVSLLSEEFAKDHEVKLAVFDASNPAYAHGGELIDLGLPATAGWLGKLLKAVRRVVDLARLFRTSKPDRIISFMESANFPCILAAVLTGHQSRLWVSVRNDPEHFPAIYRVLMRYLYRLPSKVVAPSRGVAHALATVGVSEERLICIPNPASPHAPDLSTSLPRPIDAPDRYILGVGRLHRQKGFDRLIEAFAQMDDKSLRLVILGEGKERNALARQAVTLGVVNRLHMPGALAELWPWYRHAACFVLSSRHEGWPNVLMEAMSQGCPVAAFDCKYGTNEIITHGLNGFLVLEGDVQSLARSTTQLVSNEQLAREVSAEGLRFVKQYQLSRVAKFWYE